MSSSFKRIKRVSAAFVAMGSLLATGQALAGGTAPNTNIDNVASVNYSVNGVAQTVIRSAPGAGNSAPGTAGTVTRFTVDQKVDLHLVEVNGAATPGVLPGSTGNVTTFFIRNDGNQTQGVSLSAAHYTTANVFLNASAQAMASYAVFVESTAAGAACTVPTQPGGMAYAAATDTATSIAALAPDTCTWVYVVATAPSTVTNGTFSNVELTAIARVQTTLAALSENTGADNLLSVDVVFADLAATVRDRDSYAFVTAAFNVSKTSAVINDYVSISPNFKYLPGADVEYTVTMTNTGSAQADAVTISDPLPTTTTFLKGQYNGTVSDVRVTVGSTDTFCIAEANGADGNGDGCFTTTAAGVTTLTVRNPVIAPVAAAGVATVRFRVRIN
jgi:uncharacterized repeat protein (TIGR01451 family)